MPTLRDITVHVTDSNNVKLQEWGVQTLRGHNKVSSYIKSETDMTFQVMIQPKIPYIAPDAPSAHDYETRMRGTGRPGFFKMEDEWEEIDEDYDAPGIRDRYNWGTSRSTSSGNRRRRRSGSDSDDHGQSDQLHSRNDNRSLSSPLRPRDRRRIPPPPFHFLASLYLDGRERPERKCVVYLDPDDVDYNRPDGNIQMKTCWVQGRDGRLMEHAWVFKDVGIETIFDKLLISGDHQVLGNVNKRDEDAIIAAMESTDLEPDGHIKREEKSQVGQIVVEIQRVMLGEKWVDKDFRTRLREDDIKDVNMEGANSHITHTAGFTCGKTLGQKPVRVVSYTLYKEEEGTYATFQFFYRSQENLEKFNFAGFPQSSRVVMSRQRLDTIMSGMTPLSIARPLPPSKSRMLIFEENMKRRSTNKTIEPRYNFGDSYRDDEPEFKKEKSLSAKHSLSLTSQDTMTRNITETSPSSRRDGSSATGNDGSFFKTGSSQGRYTLRSAGKENPSLVTHQAFTFTSARAPKTSTPGLFSSSDASQSFTPLTRRDRGAKTSPLDDDPTPAYRASTYQSDIDADDEHSGSDLVTEVGSDKESTDIDSPAYIDESDDDSPGLHLELKKIVIGEKRCRSPEDENDEASNDSALGDKPSGAKVAEKEGSAIRPLLLLEDPTFEEQRREMRQLQRSKENQSPAAELLRQMNAPAKRAKLSDGDKQLARNMQATGGD